MGKIERIHPELSPEDISKNKISSKDSQGVPEGKNVLSFKKAQRIFGKRQSSQEEKLTALHEDYDYFTSRYVCEKTEKPRWCIWGKNSAGDFAVLFWIKPDKYDKDIAHKLAQIMVEFGGEVYAEKTERNETLEGKPVYAQKG